MKIKTKISIAAIAIVLFMFILPWAAIELVEGLATTGLWFFTFFTVNPLIVIFLSIMAGTELRKLWWVPLLIAALFPLLFGAAIGELVWNRYVYSAIYLPVGLLAMFRTHLGEKYALRRKDGVK